MAMTSGDRLGRSSVNSEQSTSSGGFFYNLYSSFYSYFWPPPPSAPPPLNPPCCSLPGCNNPRYRDPATSRLHDYCRKGHALEHRALLASGARGLQCNTPGCPNQRCPIPNGGGYYDYCSISCRDNGSKLSPQISPSSPVPAVTQCTSPPEGQCCILPGCTRQRHLDQGTGKLHDYCRREHALEHQRSQKGPVPAHLKCRTPNCCSQRRPLPGRDGYYDYCSIRCRDNEQTFGFVILATASPERTKICDKFRKDWAKAKGQCPNVDYILEVFCGKAKKKWKDFKATLASMGSPITVEQHYHGTIIRCDLVVAKSACHHSDCGVCRISQEGFDKKLVGKNIPKFKRFGNGFYLAPHSSKCHDYTRGTHTHRAMLLCDVLPGKKYVVQTDQTDLTAPPPGYDSVYGKPGRKLNYPEIVLYNEASILPRYVILYTRDGIGKIAT